jgi:two-component system CheB/CheR fusion protein
MTNIDGGRLAARALPLRVLFVESNELILDAFLELARIASPCWEVRAARDHEAGLAMARQFAPHVICSSVGQVPKPGLSFARTIRRDARLKHAFLIAITGWNDAGTSAEIDAAGFDVCLTKPVGYELYVRHLHAFALARAVSA